MNTALAPGRRVWPRIRRLYLPLYFLVTVSVLLGGSLVRFYQGLASVDFAEVMTFIDENATLFESAAPDDQQEWERRGREAERFAERELGPGALIEPRDTRITLRLLIT